jgi:hypothetical protein
MQLSTYELKYCERCGCLRLRPAASAGTYCEPCGQMLANYLLTSHLRRATSLFYKARPKPSEAGMETGDAGLPLGRLQ